MIGGIVPSGTLGELSLSLRPITPCFGKAAEALAQSPTVQQRGSREVAFRLE
jgi:hypothetical protein